MLCATVSAGVSRCEVWSGGLSKYYGVWLRSRELKDTTPSLCTLCMRTPHRRRCQPHPARDPATPAGRYRAVRRLRRALWPRTPRRPPSPKPRERPAWGSSSRAGLGPLLPLPLIRQQGNTSTIVEQPTDLRLLTSRLLAHATAFVRAHHRERWFVYFAFGHVHTATSNISPGRHPRLVRPEGPSRRDCRPLPTPSLSTEGRRR